jgi:hypothetical protein
MAISRRQFFRGIVGQGEGRQRDDERRVVSLDNYVRTNLLPYDFALTAEQTDKVLETVRAAIAPETIESDGDLFTYERRQRMNAIVDETIGPWREEYWKAEEVRRSASPLVQEFLSIEATPDDRLKLTQRFHNPSASVPNKEIDEEIERQVQVWLAGLPNATLAACDDAALRDLVFAELRSWC